MATKTIPPSSSMLASLPDPSKLPREYLAAVLSFVRDHGTPVGTRGCAVALVNAADPMAVAPVVFLPPCNPATNPGVTLVPLKADGRGRASGRRNLNLGSVNGWPEIRVAALHRTVKLSVGYITTATPDEIRFYGRTGAGDVAIADDGGADVAGF